MTRKLTRRKHYTGVPPVARALLARDWELGSLDAEIHAFMGEDSDKLVNAAGRRFYVVLGAAVDQGLTTEDPDIRIVWGASNAIYEQAGDPVIAASRRASILSGLQAVKRLVDRIEHQHIAAAAVDLAKNLARGDVMMSDFDDLIKMAGF